jgi:predicted SAM-dependent methyltransferase
MKKLHLGCGSNYIQGWINVDINPDVKVDIRRDLTENLPFRNGEIDFIFNEHFIEHVPYPHALRFLTECYRVLKPDGVLRISTPDLKYLVSLYTADILKEYSDMNWFPRSRCVMINEGMRSWGHKFLYDLPELNYILREANFSKIKQVAWRQSESKELCMLESRPYHVELIVECVK